MSPFARAARVSGPSVSSVLNDLNLIPYTRCRPGRQNGLVWHSGPAPMTSWLDTAARSESVFRLYFCAVALVTANAFWSCAGEGVSASRPSGLRWTLSLLAVSCANPVASPAPLL